MNELGIEITSICSFDCIFCGKRENPTTLPTYKFIEVVDQALELGYNSFILIPKRGDIFCDKDIYSKLRYMKDLNVPYHFFTNLHLVDPNELLDVISPVSKIYFSDYGESDKEFEELTRRPASYRHRVLENYEKLKNIVKRAPRNRSYIKKQGENKQVLQNNNNLFCTRAYRHHICSNGDIQLCTCGAYNPLLNVGNIYDNSLKEIFTSDLYHDMIRKFIKNGMNNHICINECNCFDKRISPKQYLRHLKLWKERKNDYD